MPRNKDCPVPDCPAPKEKWPEKPNGCKCGEPLMLYIPPGEHAHPCPVHPERVIYGSDIRC